jgi:folylpolyglutamate synthase/dihydrofolate synthase
MIRWDCITINDKPVAECDFIKVENHFMQLSKKEDINASEFELLTATAFELFNKNKVEVGVVEVGMGGKLDATNILNNQVVSVISMIALEHQNFLGDTLEEIAHHKAGILRPNTSYIVNPMNERYVHDAIDRYAEEIGAGPRVLPDTTALRKNLFSTKDWHEFADPLQPFQRDNAVLAYLAFLRVLEEGNKSTMDTAALLPHLETKQIAGRLQSLQVPAVFGHDGTRKILVDGAHNENAAEALKDYVRHNLRSRPSGMASHLGTCHV